MNIILTNVLVDDQEKALAFYTGILGFVRKTDIPMGEYRWLTVVSPGHEDGVELLLEPLAFSPARTYQLELYNAGIPMIMFGVDDLQAEYDRLRGLDVVFKSTPSKEGDISVAVLEDTCGNLVQLVQVSKKNNF